MKALSKYKLNKISNNLDLLFNIASYEDIKNGKNWYNEANKICKDISKKYKVTPFVAAGVISSLSPRNNWKQNILDAHKVFQAIKDNLQPEDIKVCTFHNNKFKAFEIAKGNRTINNSSLKTYNFVNNISNDSNEYLTIDIWHLRACFLNDIKINNANIGKLAYEQIKQLTINKASKLGLKGYEYQAILWLTTQKYINSLR